MHPNCSKYIFVSICLTIICLRLTGQEASVLQFVNPFIGTSNTQTASLWGSEGGTYPGAVAPFGFVQLTPETRNGDSKGYNYTDHSILYFSCFNHLTGYPDGSSGMIHIMPVEEEGSVSGGKYSRTFSHQDEEASPGYYRVLFRDNGTMVETTAAERTGMFRFTFPPNTKPKIFLSDLGKTEIISKRMVTGTKGHAIITFSADFNEKEEISGGYMLTFPMKKDEKNILILKIGISPVDFESTLNNLRFEADTAYFNHFKVQNQQKWKKALSVIEVEDASKVNKTIFYTALYHSMLMPWIISDVKGKYKGADGSVHQVKGKNQYGGFSAWDTFRSLHPLLCLIAPDRQQDMVLSMLDDFEQSGSLPIGPMTGNHVIPIIVDSYLKGIHGFDKELAYKAMKSCLVSAMGSVDFSAYCQLGYVPASCSESVTKTVEFAYDDWALSQFAGKVMNDQKEYSRLLNRSSNYKNLFHAQGMALLPRLGNKFNLTPGSTGYKEGDHWSYSMFVPQDPIGLVNLFGGDTEFSAHLDSALTMQFILFDNEPVLHVPYLFNYSNRPDLTQRWVRNLMQTHYTTAPGGLPGNDDHGAMSSWYVFSAMGLYPVSPGRPIYDLGSPLFNKVVIHLQNGKNWIINSKNNEKDRPVVRKTLLNGESYHKLWISHTIIMQGGEVTFEMDKGPEPGKFSSDCFKEPDESTKLSDFNLTGVFKSQKKVAPDELFYVPFILQNRGSKGTKIVRLFVDDKEFARKNILVDEKSTVIDSIGCRLYPVGNRSIRIDQFPEHKVEVIQRFLNSSPGIQIVDLKCPKIFKKNSPIDYRIVVQNKWGIKLKESIPVSADDSVYQEEVVTLEPGEIKTIERTQTFKSKGIHKLQVGAKLIRIYVYGDDTDSKIIDINTNNKTIGDTIFDRSALLNNALIHRNSDDLNHFFQGIQTDSLNYAEFAGAESLDNPQEKITVMAWIKPLPGNNQLSDIITKGDFIALQASGNKSLSWFAGGWGRGSISADLPDNWVNNWHHIAGVADGRYLKLYIDGVESAGTTIDRTANFASHAHWMIGRNEEFPDQRFFNGFVDHFKIFAEPLTEAEIKEEMEKGNRRE